MNFSDPSKVVSQIENIKTAELDRAPARALVDILFNGGSPWTEKEAEENHVHLNCNFGDGADLLLQGRTQYENALLTTGNFFGIRLPDCPPSKREKYEASITRRANKCLKQSLPYLQTQRQKLGSMALHGPGPQAWEDDENPIPYFVPVPDLLIPTDTDITLSECNYFFIRRKMKPGSLFRKTFNCGKNVDPGWNLSFVRKILNDYEKLNENPNSYDWANNPEQMQEIYKQNLSWFEQDSAPSIWAWDCYWQEDEQDDQGWQRAMVLDNNAAGSDSSSLSGPVQWVFRSGHKFSDKGKAEKIEGSRSYADNIGQILHVNFSDGNNVPPFMYHSCRGMGLRLYDAVMIKNRLMCQFLTKVFEDLVPWFRANDPADRARINEILLGSFAAIFPAGLEMVKNDERYKMDANQVEMAAQFLKQNLGEGAAGYTQDPGLDDKKERTATEVNTLIGQATKITSGMINLAYLQEDFAYTEIVRRLCKPDTHNFMSKRFQEGCVKDCGEGIRKWLDVDRMDIASERVMGGGNAQMELGQAQALQAIRPTLNPKGQAIVTNKYVFAVTHDPDLTEQIAPRDGAPGVSNTQHDSQIAFGILMSGYPLSPVPGINPMEVVTTIVPLMEAEIKNIMMSGGVGQASHIKGLINCNQYVSAYLQELEGDKSNAQFVKAFGDRLGNVMNEVKAMGQRQQQAAQKQAQQNGNGAPQPDPEKMVKAKLAEVEGAKKIQRKDQDHKQKLAHRQQDFAAQQQQNKMKALNEITLKSAEAVSKPKPEPKKSGFDE